MMLPPRLCSTLLIREIREKLSAWYLFEATPKEVTDWLYLFSGSKSVARCIHVGFDLNRRPHLFGAFADFCRHERDKDECNGAA